MAATKAQERLSAILAEANQIAAKGVFSKDESAKLEALMIEGHELKAAIQATGRLGALNDWAGESAGLIPLAPGTEGVRGMALGAKESGASVIEGYADRTRRGVTLLEQYGEGIFDAQTLKVTGHDGYRQAFRSYIRGGVHGLKLAELKTLQEGADTSGGFLVPADILEMVISRMPTPTRVAGLVTQLQTSRDQLIIPKVAYTTDDLYTTGIRATWTGEVPASATTHRVTDPVFGQVSVPVYTAMLSMPLTNDMVEDSAFPIVSYSSGKFSETIDLLRDNMILNGTGLGQPSGILVNPGADSNQPAVVVSGSASAITAAGFISTAFALPEQYDDSARWCFNKTSTASALAGLYDGNQRYLWGSGLQDSGLAPGWKDRALLGYPVVLSGFMPDVGANHYPAIFGDFRGHFLVNRIGFSVQVLRELYAETNQILLLGRIRFGGLCAEPWKFRILKCST